MKGKITVTSPTLLSFEQHQNNKHIISDNSKSFIVFDDISLSMASYATLDPGNHLDQT